MKHRVISYSVEVIAAALLSIQTAQAQDSAPGLQDLVGARVSSGEQLLQKRGYPFVKGEKSGSGSYTYWRKGRRSGGCIIVRTAEGRYQSLVKAPDLDCQASNAADGVPAVGLDEYGSRFNTVCGVIVDRKTYRYK